MSNPGDNNGDGGNLFNMCLERRDKTLIKELNNVMINDLADVKDVCDIIKENKEELCIKFEDLYIDLIKRISLKKEEIDIDISKSHNAFLAITADTIDEQSWIVQVARSENNKLVNRVINSENFHAIEHEIKTWDDLYYKPLTIHQIETTLTDNDKIEFKNTVKDFKYKYTSTEKSYSSVIPCKGAAKIGEDGLLHDMVKRELEWDALNAYNLQAIIEYKWNHYGKRYLVIDMILHLILLTFFTVYCILMGYVKNENSSLNRSLQNVLLSPSWVISVLNLYTEIVQFLWIIHYCRKKTKGKHWAKTIYEIFYEWAYSRWNIFELIMYVCIIFIIPCLEWHYISKGHITGTVMQAMIAITACLVWWKLLYYLFPFENTGPQVIMIFEVLSDIRIFLFIVVLILLGFSTMFFSLFSDTDHTNFNEYHYSLVTTYTMMLGEFDQDKITGTQLSPLITILFMLYMFIMTIVLLNLLIAIMGDSFDRIKKREEVSFYVARCATISDMENKMPRCHQDRIK